VSDIPNQLLAQPIFRSVLDNGDVLECICFEDDRCGITRNGKLLSEPNLDVDAVVLEFSRIRRQLFMAASSKVA